MGDSERKAQWGARINTHKDLEVYQRSFKAGMDVFRLSKEFPREEMYSLTDQIRKSSRSVSANLAEAWRKRRYQASFISKLSDAETEAAETQVWLEYAVACDYLDRDTAADLYRRYNQILATIVGMIDHCETWIIRKKR